MKKFASIYRDDLEDFIHQNLTERPSALFREVESHAVQSRVPILSPATGEVLKFLVYSLSPGRILELGTGLGYSTLWMLSTGIPLTIDTWERNQVCIDKAMEFINYYRFSHQVVNFFHAHIVESLTGMDNLHSYDFIFVDCDKICYPELLELLPGKMKSGSKLVFDNVLWHGRLKKEIHTRPSDLAIQKFWEIVTKKFKDRTLFPVGDGLLLLKV